MPSPSYKQNKSHIYTWREKNQDRYRAIVRRSDEWKKITKVFRNILY